jgi:hypothetical protein
MDKVPIMNKFCSFNKIAVMILITEDMNGRVLHDLCKGNWTIANNSDNNESYLFFDDTDSHFLSHTWLLETLIGLVARVEANDPLRQQRHNKEYFPPLSIVCHVCFKIILRITEIKRYQH